MRLNMSQMCQLDFCFGVFGRWPVNPNKSFSKMKLSNKVKYFYFFKIGFYWFTSVQQMFKTFHVEIVLNSWPKVSFEKCSAGERRPHVISYEGGHPRKALFFLKWKADSSTYWHFCRQRIFLLLGVCYLQEQSRENVNLKLKENAQRQRQTQSRAKKRE